METSFEHGDFESQGFRLSPQQLRIWSLALTGARGQVAAVRLADAAPGHLRIELRGELDRERLLGALRRVVARHEILRTRLLCPRGLFVPVQVIAEAAEIELAREEAAADGSAGERDEPLSAHLSPLAEEGWSLELRLSAAHADSLSLRLLAGELAAAYAAAGAGAAAADGVLQYADLSELLHGIAEGEAAEDGRRFWAKRSAAGVVWPPLPLERPAAADGRFEVRFCPVPLAAGVAAALERLAERRAVGPESVFLGAWALLLARLTDSSEVTVACAYDGRSYEGFETALGPLERYLPVRSKVDLGERFDTFAGGLHDRLEALFDYQELYPPTTEPAAPWAFVFEEGEGSWSAGGLSFSLAHHSTAPEPFAVRLGVCRRGGRGTGPDALELELAYDPRRLSRASVERMSAELAVLLEAVAADPGRALEGYDLLGEAERRTALAWSASEPPPEEGYRGAVGRFLEQVELRPDAPALVCGERAMSYRELAAAAHELARSLRRRGVGAETVVGIYLERSPELVAAILGVLEAGGAYLPLDPEYPRERTARVLELADAALVVTRERLAGALPAPPERLLLLEAEPPPAAGGRDVAADPAPPESLAYLMFTSGSTGEPKGVMLSRRSLDGYLASLPPTLGVGGDDVYLHTASFAFSSSVRHLLVPLSRGGTVVVATAEERLDPRRLLERLRESGVTVMDTVPTFWRSCVEARRQLEDAGAEPASGGDRLRLSLSTGAPLAAEIPREWCRGREGELSFFNMYGQTETTGMVAVHRWRCREAGPALAGGEEARVPIGRPVPGSSIYVLDRRARPVPIGCAGELHVGGPGPGRGYLHQPRLTAERFVPDAFGGQRGARLFRTGDLGQFDAEGLLRFAGRIDHQTQVRGFRVEPGEVEAVLARHPAVAQCALRPWPTSADDSELAAYVVAAEGLEVDAQALRRFVEERLPPYMVPGRFVALEALPLTPNGKVDYRALPEPEHQAHGTYVAPATELERELAQLWQEVLEVERVGREDDFFDLGGHSMRGILIMSQAQERYGVEIPPYRLFEARTVARLAALIEEQQLAAAGDAELAEALGELDGLSDEEVRSQLAEGDG